MPLYCKDKDTGNISEFQQNRETKRLIARNEYLYSEEQQRTSTTPRQGQGLW